MVSTGLPPLSSIQAWDVDHLTDAADHWEGTADHGRTFPYRFGSSPTGLTGKAKPATLWSSATTDKTTIISKADQLR